MNLPRALKVTGAITVLTIAAIPLGIVSAVLYEAHEREEALRAAKVRHPAGKGLRP